MTGRSFSRASGVAGACAALALAAAGCGGASEQKSTSAAADVTAQVEQVCRQATGEFDKLPEPTDTRKAVEAQLRSAQIFSTMVGRLNELETNVGLPVSYKGWLDQLDQLPALNQKAADAFSRDGVTSDQAVSAGEAWHSKADQANDLARQAGLSGCVFG